MGHSALFGVLIDHVRDKIILVDEQGRATYANDAVKRRLGYEPATLVDEDIFDYIHPADRETTRDAFERTIAAETYTETTVEYRFRTADGSYVWLESRMSNLTDEALEGYVVSSRDIDDRVTAEREREEAATRLEEIAATAGDVLWMFSGDWSELLFVNPAYESVHGDSVDQLRADPSSFLEAVHPEDRPRVEAAMDQLSSGMSVDVEYRVTPENGDDIWIWAQGEPIVQDGEVVRIAGFARDITDRKRRSRQLCVMDKLLRHNLRNDLTTILGQAEYIEESAPETSERVAVIRRTGEALLATAEKQRDIIDILTSDIHFETRDVREIVDRSAAVVRDRFEAANIDITGPSSVSACVIPHLRHGITELLENAVSHSEQGRPHVDVAVRSEAESVVVDVRDDGPPIPENEAQVLTGEYEMSDVYHSTGLGLWLVYWVIDLMDGSITVDREPAGNLIRLRFSGRPRATPVKPTGSTID